jgi:hypothetical protein
MYLYGFKINCGSSIDIFDTPSGAIIQMDDDRHTAYIGYPIENTTIPKEYKEHLSNLLRGAFGIQEFQIYNILEERLFDDSGSLVYPKGAENAIIKQVIA